MTQIKPLLFAAAVALIATPALAGDGAKGEAWKAARTAAFAEADANGDGALNPEEFQAFQQAMKRRKAELRFAKLDANDDGQITAEELQSGHRHRGKCDH